MDLENFMILYFTFSLDNKHQKIFQAKSNETKSFLEPKKILKHINMVFKDYFNYFSRMVPDSFLRKEVIG